MAMVERLDGSKDFEGLIRSAALIKNKVSKLRVNIVGDGFYRHSETLGLLILFQSLNVVSGPASSFLMMANYQKLFLKMVLAGIAIVLMVSWTLGENYNAFGAALGVTLGYGSVNILALAAALMILLKKGHRFT